MDDFKDLKRFENDNLIGCKERIFKVEEIFPFKIYFCPNNIGVVTLLNKNMKYSFYGVEINKKVKKNFEFIEIENKKYGLPFKCKIIELQENNNEYFTEYIAIVLRFGK
ncbi:hypothetical protein CWI38_1499p0030 [Hamiltosporidium tvaerminnensis]|uniref:Uncharacterized protein n=2 Tax=Hamiltosporidium TaxID=1176354 RepID=A0A4Q9L397_9MICR|nr:hypothetical protein CWI39_2532p0010 [Hamiltosporidium magnivora]TBU01959.1 hypothetical protein CWI37_0589p0020 [Hamiltosporidium tvaerminnensis]TBU10874.1 hypothetical protein CWI38_1499p0030 [Hamiltosporidium tvaerminnensis]